MFSLSDLLISLSVTRYCVHTYTCNQPLTVHSEYNGFRPVQWIIKTPILDRGRYTVVDTVAVVGKRYYTSKLLRAPVYIVDLPTKVPITIKFSNTYCICEYMQNMLHNYTLQTTILFYMWLPIPPFAHVRKITHIDLTKRAFDEIGSYLYTKSFNF